jgi:seryl-tRNA synthetase
MAMQRMVGEGFTLLTVPSIAREAAFVGTGHFPTGRTEVYELPEDNLFLSGTAEIVLVHSGEILESLEQAILYAGVSPCFRREAGSAGRDVRGLLRVHQFFKVEQYRHLREQCGEVAVLARSASQDRDQHRREPGASLPDRRMLDGRHGRRQDPHA